MSLPFTLNVDLERAQKPGLFHFKANLRPIKYRDLSGNAQNVQKHDVRGPGDATERW